MSPAILSWSFTKIVLTVAAMVFLFIVALEMYALAPVLPSDFSSNSALHQEASSRLSKETAPDGRLHLGLFGEAMVAMLGSTDLPFTIFVPSKATFQKFFKIFPELSDEQAEKSSLLISADNNSDVYAALSRVFSFSAIPKPIFSHDLSEEQEIEAEALSGYKLYLSRVPGKGFLVNNLVCEFTDLRRGRVVMHVVNGVLLDPAFRRSMAFQNEALDDENREGDGGWSLQLMTFYLGAYEKKFVFLTSVISAIPWQYIYIYALECHIHHNIEILHSWNGEMQRWCRFSRAFEVISVNSLVVGAEEMLEMKVLWLSANCRAVKMANKILLEISNFEWGKESSFEMPAWYGNWSVCPFDEKSWWFANFKTWVSYKIVVLRRQETLCNLWHCN